MASHCVWNKIMGWTHGMQTDHDAYVCRLGCTSILSRASQRTQPVRPSRPAEDDAGGSNPTVRAVAHLRGRPSVTEVNPSCASHCGPHDRSAQTNKIEKGGFGGGEDCGDWLTTPINLELDAGAWESPARMQLSAGFRSYSRTLWMPWVFDFGEEFQRSADGGERCTSSLPEGVIWSTCGT